MTNYTVRVLIRDGASRALDRTFTSRTAADKAIIDHVMAGTDQDYWHEVEFDLAHAIEFLQLHGHSVTITEHYPEEE